MNEFEFNAMQARVQSTCRHKFVDSKCCLKCGWIPPEENAATIGVDRESDLHEQIFAECRRRGWIALHGSMASPTRRTEGEPDFVILGHRMYGIEGDCGPSVLFVECKTRLGKLSPAQQAFHAHAAKLGHQVHVVRSFKEFLALL